MNQSLNEQIVVERREAAVWLTFNRPQAMNALTPHMMRTLGDTLERVREDQQVRSIVITGAGKAFCAGVDLMAMEGATSLAEGTSMFKKVADPVVAKMEQYPKPIIAAVNGLALAGGLEIILACDLVYAASSAKFGDAHANFGLIPGGGSTAKLPRRVGVALAKQMIFSGMTVDAATMHRAGLVNDVVSPEQLLSLVGDMAALLAKKSPLGIARCKSLIDEGLDLPLAEAVARETVATIKHSASKDAIEGVSAFAAKRQPAFVGA
jgi:enoyl-CoA hydratase